MATSDATKEALWLIELLNEMTTLKEKPTVHIDNESIIKLIKNPEFHCRTKQRCAVLLYDREIPRGRNKYGVHANGESSSRHTDKDPRSDTAQSSERAVGIM